LLKRILSILVILISVNSVNAYEDCIITNDGKITDINIEDNSIIDVFPIVTIMNEKNTLMVHPLKPGKTRFCALKNEKNLVLFDVYVNDAETRINAPDGFEVLTIDPPNDEFEFILDEPPILNGGGKI